MTSKLLLALALVLSGVLFGCSTAAPRPVAVAPIYNDTNYYGRNIRSNVSSEERDILKLVEENPLNIEVEGKIAKYGDPFLARAVDKLSDISRPWTVPKMIRLFEDKSHEWLQKLQERRVDGNNQMWPEWNDERERCGYLARVLAASRDPRAAVALGKTLDNHDFPGRIEVASALFDYFVRDINYGLPPEKHLHNFAGNTYDATIPAVQRWWALNKSQLEAQVEKMPTP